MKKVLSAVLAAVLIFALASCGKESEEIAQPTPANLLALKDPSGWGLVKVMTDRDYAFNVTFCDTADEIASKLKSGETDFAAIPVDAAVKLYNETDGQIKVIAISSTGCFHILSNDKEIKSLSDLAGRKLYVSETEIMEKLMFEYLLDKNEIENDELPEIIYLPDNDEVVNKALETGSDTYLLPVKYAAKVLAADKGVGQVISFKREWDKLNDTPFTLGCIVGRKEFIENNPSVVSDLKTFAEVSLNYTAEDTLAGKALLDAGLFEDIETAEKIITGCYFEFIDGEEIADYISKCLTALYGEESEYLGGKVPGKDFVA